MTTLVNLPAASSLSLVDVIGVDRSPSGNLATQKASLGQVVGLIPLATTSTAGLVQIGAGLTMTNGVLSVTGGGGSNYVLPTATNATLGGVKIDGTTITIANGVISAATGGAGGGANNPTFTGNITANSPNSSLILGQANVFGTSNIDFRVFGWVLNQYDVRLSASGGFINANGQGTLNIIAANLQFNGIPFVPGAFATLNSPTFTGTPQTTKPPTNDNSLKIPTTSWFYDQVNSAAVVTSLAGDGTAGAVVAAADGTPSIRHDYQFQSVHIPTSDLVVGQSYVITVRNAVTVSSFIAGVTNVANGISVQVDFSKNGTLITGLGAVACNNVLGAKTPTSAVGLAVGDTLSFQIASITGSPATTGVLNIQPVGVWA